VDEVWSVLADGFTYASWVVGASRVRAVDAGWPGVGSRIHHSVGSWPLLLDDVTEVLGCDPGRLLELQAKGWPAGEARVELELAPSDEAGPGGCRIEMREDVTHGPARLVPAPVRQVAIAPRNEESLQRLAYLAERPRP
jgi:Polyketide cyclase / dehydrase and lipid transport